MRETAEVLFFLAGLVLWAPWASSCGAPDHPEGCYERPTERQEEDQPHFPCDGPTPATTSTAAEWA